MIDPAIIADLESDLQKEVVGALKVLRASGIVDIQISVNFLRLTQIVEAAESEAQALEAIRFYNTRALLLREFSFLCTNLGD